MKKIVIVSLLMTCLPYMSWAQSVDDDLYFIPKKKSETKAEIKQTVKDVVPKSNTTNVYTSPGSTVIVRDHSGKTRDVDEYNRQYSARDNNFTMDNDTLYIDEKPLNERGEWVNGFDGTQDDYEYAMRIVRFRNPRYAIPVSSPFYWDAMYSLPSWEWNVYDDGFYAYAFPTFSNRLWWDWRWNYPYGGWGWNNSWYGGWYDNWYGPGFYGCYGFNSYWGWNHYGWGYPGYCGGPYYGGWGRGHGFYGSSAVNPGIHKDRYYNQYGRNNNGYQGSSSRGDVQNNNRTARTNNRNSRYEYMNGSSANSSSQQTRSGRGSYTSGRVVEGSNGYESVRPNRSAIRSTVEDAGNSRGGSSVRSTYTRPSSVNGNSSSYDRPSSTRSSVRDSYNSGAAQRGAYRNSSSNNDSYRSSSRSSYSNYNSGSSRSSYSGGGSSSRSSYSGGSSSGSHSSSGGGAGRGRTR